MSKRYEIESDSQQIIAREPSTKWGGSWTEEKLDAFEKYVNAYLTIMNTYRTKWGWKLVYFDGFAGSGSRESKNKEYESNLLQELFKDDSIAREELDLYKGAAERVLGIKQRGFDYYYFIDKDKESSEKLQKLLSVFENGNKIKYINSDANEQVKLLAEAMHKNKTLASLALLDPFGMQVNWKSIECLKGTRTDLWILIPTGVIVNRLLDRKGELVHIDKLTSFFGMDEESFGSQDAANAFVPPEWFGEEVTYNKEYHNSYMSKIKFD